MLGPIFSCGVHLDRRPSTACQELQCESIRLNLFCVPISHLNRFVEVDDRSGIRKVPICDVAHFVSQMIGRGGRIAGVFAYKDCKSIIHPDGHGMHSLGAKWKDA